MEPSEARNLIVSETGTALDAVKQGERPTGLAETLFEATVAASSLLHGRTLREASDTEVLEALGRAFLTLGYAQLALDRNDTRKLDAVLKLAKRVLGKEPYTTSMQQALDAAYQDWHWHGH